VSDVPDQAVVSYPFTAIVGQEQMRLALLLNAVDPRIGGVLIRGEKGTGKSTIARALAGLLPEQRVVRDCPYNCDPDNPAEQDAAHRGLGSALSLALRPVRVVELPLNASEERLAGTLDLRAALTEGAYRFEPGLLASANRGILYVDEVNLLPDHLVDLVLDAAAMGRNAVEREGVSVNHPARFVLIGTMNPEEGELRPQLLDRFGLCVDVSGIAELGQRVDVMRRRLAFDRDPAAFADEWRVEQAALRARVVQARTLLPGVSATEETLRTIASLCIELGVDGHRADLVILRAAAAIAALEGRADVTREDVKRAAAFALPHRMRRRPFEEERFTDQRLEDALGRQEEQSQPEDAQAQEGQSSKGPDQPPAGDAATPPSPPPSRTSDPLALPALDLARDRTPRTGAGRRQPTPSADTRGRAVRAEVPRDPSSAIALGATVRAAALHAPSRPASGALTIAPDHLRAQVRERTVGTSIIFIVDASGSMAAQRRLAAAKGAALTLLREAYQRRDRVALIAFRGQGAELILPLTNSVELVQARLEDLLTGGRTPLAAGLQAALDLVRQTCLKDPRAICIPVLLTDGKANVSQGNGSPVEEALAVAEAFRQPGVHPLVLDAEHDFLTFGLAGQLAERAGAQYVRLADLTGEAVAAAVQQTANTATI